MNEEKSMVERYKLNYQYNKEILDELKQLNEYKRQQLDSDKLFREMWEQLKRTDELHKKTDKRFTILAVFVAVMAFGLQIIQLEDFYIIQHRIMQVVEPLVNVLGVISWD